MIVGLSRSQDLGMGNLGPFGIGVPLQMEASFAVSLAQLWPCPCNSCQQHKVRLTLPFVTSLRLWISC